MEAETERVKEEMRAKAAPVCAKCEVVRPCRFLILTCSFAGSALLWWAFNLPTWVKVEVAGGLQVLFSALFAVCSGEVVCWVPPPKSNCFLFGRIFMIGALLLSLFLSFALLAFPHLLPDTSKQYFVLTITFSITGVCVMLALLLHSLHVWKACSTFRKAKVTFLYPSFILLLSATLFFVSGILCFLSSHHCWRRCGLPQPIRVQPKPASPATEREPGGGG